jgi:hypothetical protein
MCNLEVASLTFYKMDILGGFIRTISEAQGIKQN